MYKHAFNEYGNLFILEHTTYLQKLNLVNSGVIWMLVIVSILPNVSSTTYAILKDEIRMQKETSKTEWEGKWCNEFLVAHYDLYNTKCMPTYKKRSLHYVLKPQKQLKTKTPCLLNDKYVVSIKLSQIIFGYPSLLVIGYEVFRNIYIYIY